MGVILFLGEFFWLTSFLGIESNKRQSHFGPIFLKDYLAISFLSVICLVLIVLLIKRKLNFWITIGCFFIILISALLVCRG